MKAAIAIVVVLVVLIGGYFLFAHPAQAPAPTTATTTDSASGTQGAVTPNTNPSVVAAVNSTNNTVSYNGATFTPAKLSIKNGDAVQFINNSKGEMWVASDPHPTHQGYSGTTESQHCPDTTGTAFDECTSVPAGGVYTFIFKKTGSWGYHNHDNHDAQGTIVVTN